MLLNANFDYYPYCNSVTVCECKNKLEYMEKHISLSQLGICQLA